jgi:hypothetical protein
MSLEKALTFIQEFQKSTPMRIEVHVSHERSFNFNSGIPEFKL